MVLFCCSYLSSVTMSCSTGLIDLWKFVFCFLIDVWINSKIYLNVPELILKYLQNLSSSLSKSSRRLWNSLKLSCLELILCTQNRLFLGNKRLLHQILSINENTCSWFDILPAQKCQLHSFQFGSAWPCNVNSHSLCLVQLGPFRFSSTRLGLQCKWGNTLKYKILPFQKTLITYWSIPMYYIKVGNHKENTIFVTNVSLSTTWNFEGNFL